MDETLALEKKARNLASQSISKIEIALADWEQSKKPKELTEKIKYLKKAHKLFSNWMKKSLKGKKDHASAQIRLKMFSDICYQLRTD